MKHLCSAVVIPLSKCLLDSFTTYFDTTIINIVAVLQLVVCSSTICVAMHAYAIKFHDFSPACQKPWGTKRNKGDSQAEPG